MAGSEQPRDTQPAGDPPDEDVSPPEPSLPPDAPEADVLEQAQPWGTEDREPGGSIPPDASEADVLDQRRPAGLEDEDRDGG